MLCYFRAQKHDVRFGLANVGGVELDDPEGLLGGTSDDGKHVKLASVDDIDRTRFAGWLAAVIAHRS
jgi:hypothetical protein